MFRLLCRAAALMTVLLFSLLLLCPAVHEAGHLLAAALTGGQVERVVFFGSPSIRLTLFGGTPAQALFIAACGGWAPLLLLWLPDKPFWLFGIKVTAALLSLFAGAESAVRGLLYLYKGIDAVGCDAVILLKAYPKEEETVFLILFVQMAVAAAFLLRAHPLYRLVRHWS